MSQYLQARGIIMRTRARSQLTIAIVLPLAPERRVCVCTRRHTHTHNTTLTTRTNTCACLHGGCAVLVMPQLKYEGQWRRVQPSDMHFMTDRGPRVQTHTNAVKIVIPPGSHNAKRHCTRLRRTNRRGRRQLTVYACTTLERAWGQKVNSVPAMCVQDVDAQCICNLH